MLSMQIELIGCLLLKFWLTLGSVVSTPQLCTLAEWYSLTVDLPQRGFEVPSTYNSPFVRHVVVITRTGFLWLQV